MAKFHGKVGYAQTVETAPGVHTETFVEYDYVGDVQRDAKRWVDGSKVNTDLQFSTRISIIVNDVASVNLPLMRYVRWQGACWQITSFEVAHPRIILTLGGVYNGRTATT